ncbi:MULTISPECIES: DUF3822 family protein [unclassified Algoriphagus]|uniref:DUF3822 family protein n=1 Tax=unclassified Algoriphagus TaxID=2641541 RepID=UPI001C62C54A|nr:MULTISPECIES: DUF3822 family protein [unclassified Algoriphagus]QYH39129.1 DUF3822 family protein [Algoriphagus sp. NBT04N3]
MENTLKVFKSDKFDVEDTASLSLFLYPDFLVIFAKDQNQSNTGIHYYPKLDIKSLDQLILTDPLLRLDVPARLFIHHPGFSLVPGVLYSSGNEAQFLSFSKEVPDNAFYFNTPLDSNNLQVLSYVDEKMKKHLEARFSDLSFYHGSCSFLSYLFKERFNLIGQEIIVNVFGKQMYVAAFTDQELSTFNLFEIQSKEDILKYVLILIEQLHYDRNHVRISVFGIPAKSEITENWGKQYFQNFRILVPHANQNYSHGFKHLKDLGLFEVSWQYL